MPTATNDGVALGYRADGDGETVAFVGDAGFGAWLWGWQAPAVAGPYEALVADLRGAGWSAAPPGPYDVDALAADLEAVLAARGARRVHVVGAGLGGAVALRYARAYDRSRSLAVFGAAASGDDVDRDALAALRHVPGDREAARAALAGAFTDRFLAAADDLVDRILAWRDAEDPTGEAWEAQAAAATGFEAGPLYELGLPALVCHGVDDPVVPLAAGERLADDLPRGAFEPVAGRRLCFVEHSGAVSDRLLGFLDEHAGDGERGGTGR